MTVSVAYVTLDCDDVAALAVFWSAALDLPVDPEPSPYFASVNRHGPHLPRFLFLKVPEGKTAKNRMHLDLVVDNSGSRGDEIARLLGLGAKHLADKDEWGHSWAVLSDPEGNEFCLASGT